MKRLMLTVTMLLGALPTMAQSLNAEILDTAARSAQKRSVMFMDPEEAEQIRRQEEERLAYEQERQRAYEEEQRRAYEEQMRREEEARREALKPVNLFGRSLKIYARINGEILTSRDMQDRVNIFVATTQIPIKPETKDMIMGRVLDAAIDEKIKLQEAEKNGIKISPDELDKGMERFAQSNGLSVADFKKILREAEVDENVFKSQMKAEMAWGRLIQRKASQEIRIMPDDVRRALDKVTKDIHLEKYMLAQIVIPKNKAAHIQDLVETLRQDPRFELYAMQFSTDPSSKNGGQLGWINKTQLPEAFAPIVKGLKEGDVSDPVSVGADYYILKLQRIYRPGIDKAPVPDEKAIRNMLENQKTEEIASRYLRNLRNKAIVERRG